MDVWVSGGLALVGALAGVFLSSFLSSSIKRKDARRARLEEALRRITAALAAENFATRVGASNAPPGLVQDDIRQLEVRLFISNLERYYTTLHDARHSVAMLAADSFDIGDSWRTAEAFQRDAEGLYERLNAELAKLS